MFKDTQVRLTFVGGIFKYIPGPVDIPDQGLARQYHGRRILIRGHPAGEEDVAEDIGL